MIGSAFDWLWHLRGSAIVESTLPNLTILDRVALELGRQSKPIKTRTDNFVEFNDPLWRSSGQKNRLGLVLYDRGRIWVERDEAGTKVRYDLRSLHAMMYMLGGALLLGLLASFVQDGPTAIKFGFGIFAFGYGVNVLLALAKVPGLFSGSTNGT